MVARVMIGGVERELPPLRFKQLKKIWPRLRAVFEVEKGYTDPLAAVDSLIFIVATATERSEAPMSVDEVEDLLEPQEIQGLFPSVQELITESGITLAGEAGPAGEAAGAPSTETSDSSSAS